MTREELFERLDDIEWEDFGTDFRTDYLEIPGISYRLSEEENLYQYFFSIMDRLVKKIDLPFNLQSSGLASDDQPQLTAIREALVNLLMHSDYFSTMKPRIRAFSDRIEYMNPGRLPKDIEAIMQEDFTQPRNPVSARIFRVIKLAETAGSGFDKMFRGWQAYYRNRPEVVSGIDYYKITFRFGDTPQKTTQKTPKTTEEDILAEIRKHPKIGRRELAGILGNISEDGVKYHIGKLKKEGTLKRIGPPKGGHWKVVKRK